MFQTKQESKAIVEKSLTLPEIKTLTYLISGFMITESFYDGLANVRIRYEDMLNESLQWVKGNYNKLDVPGSEESGLHRMLKAVTIRHLIENEKIDPANIHVEEEVRKD